MLAIGYFAGHLGTASFFSREELGMDVSAYLQSLPELHRNLHNASVESHGKLIPLRNASELNEGER